MNSYDIVIIGGGLGGLESGLILSKEGLKICILEQHHKLGGNLQTFTRDGCIFDTGMHYFGSMEEGQYLRKYFDYFGITDKLNLKQLNKKGFETISFSGDHKKYLFAQGYDEFVASLLEQFPGNEKDIRTYLAEIKSVTKSFPLFNPEEIESYFIPVELMERCASGVFNAISNNDKLKNVLAGSVSLYPGYAEKTPFYIHACIRDSVISSCWRPVDGSQQIADNIEKEIISHGGEIRTSCKVKEILIENDKAIAVLLENGEKVYGNSFISNAHPVSTLKMIPEGKIRKFYRNRITSLENSQGAFIVYGILEENSFPYLNSNFFHYRNKGVFHPSLEKENWPDNFYFYTQASSKDKDHASSFMVMADMKFDEVSRWQDTKVNRRGADYKEFKAKKAEKLLDALEERFPGIKSKTKKIYTSTPLTFRDYTGTHEGTAYGIMKDCSDPMRSIILPRTKVSNLLFTGQNLNLHGIMGVTAGAVITCSEILGLKYLTNKIANG